MNDYKKLAVRYLQMNKKRTAFTIAGVTIAVMVLFVILNLGWSWVLHYREQIREENNYEIVLLTESEEKIEQMLADNRIKDAYLGSYYYVSQNGDKLYPNALYVNTINPYKMDSILNQLKVDYGVEGEHNPQLAMTYFNDGSDNIFVILLLLVLLFSYIFAIFGVGIIRNSIQLSTLEQIKDYGNLRCIGASKGQLKAFIYLEGAIMETSGILIGILLGTGISVFAGHFMKMKAGFHFVPLVPIAIAFLGDLYFAMQENCKVIAHMTPISAVRGEYKIRKEKIKVRNSRIIGKLFGVEGDYAYKNIMRSPGRFFKTVFTIGLGIAALIAGGGVGRNFLYAEDMINERYNYYQVYVEAFGNYWNTAEEIHASLPAMEKLEGLAKINSIKKVKRLYSLDVMLAEDSMLNHVSEQYANETSTGGVSGAVLEKMEQAKQAGEEAVFIEEYYGSVKCYGYDDEDYGRYKKALVEGTLDISDHGLVLVNGGMLAKIDEDTESLGFEFINVTFTDYKVGDTVKIVDMKKLKETVRKRIAKLDTDEPPVKSTSQADETDDQGFMEEDTADANQVREEEERRSANDKEKRRIAYECWQELIQEGAYETYTIEGIVDKDVNHEAISPCFVLPLSHYHALTGTDETENTGMQYHVENYLIGESIANYIYDNMYDSGVIYWSDMNYDISEYADFMQLIKETKNVLYVIDVFVLFIVSMSSFNIINTTASNLQLRKKEFAQLRVIGISRKRLIRIVLLEGAITAIMANILGIIAGCGMGYLFNWFIYMLTGIKYRLPVLFILLGIVLSFALLCGSIYFPLKDLKQDMAADLAASGE